MPADLGTLGTHARANMCEQVTVRINPPGVDTSVAADDELNPTTYSEGYPKIFVTVVHLYQYCSTAVRYSCTTAVASTMLVRYPSTVVHSAARAPYI